MASGSRRDLELCDLTTSATRSSAVFATSPSALGHLDQERHRGSSPASPRNHQHSGIWVGVEPPPFRIHVVYCMRRFSAVLGSRSSFGFTLKFWVVLWDLLRVLLQVLHHVISRCFPGMFFVIYSGFFSMSSPGSSPGSFLHHPRAHLAHISRLNLRVSSGKVSPSGAWYALPACRALQTGRAILLRPEVAVGDVGFGCLRVYHHFESSGILRYPRV